MPLRATTRDAKARFPNGKHVVSAGKLARGGKTCAELVTRLQQHGFQSEIDASITNKLASGTLSATFFLACIAALELDSVALEEM